MPRTRVKICGITRIEDALAACEAGADALGFVFWAGSKRALTAAAARDVIARLPPFVTTVGLFMDSSESHVWDVLGEVPLAMLQFHGDESADFCERFDKPYIKALPMGAGHSPQDYAAPHETALGFLLDSHAPGEAGGTGTTFDWTRVPDDFTRPIILAGGLTPANVREAVRTVRPWAVDVSSGVESAPGIKDIGKMQTFIEQVRLADAEQ